MKIFISVSMIAFSIINCHTLKKNQEEKVSGIILERIVPDIYFDSLKNQMIVSRYVPYYTKVFFYKNQVLLQSSYQYQKFDLAKTNEDGKSEYLNIQPEETRYFTFVYSNKSAKGWLCDSNNIKTGRVVRKDSLLEKQWIILSQKSDILQSSYHRLITSTTSKDGIITERYELKDKKDTSMTGSLTLIFSKKKIESGEYSLGKEIEQQKSMKLIKLITINDSRFIPPTNTFIDRMEISYELKKLDITNEQELIEMFKVAETSLY